VDSPLPQSNAAWPLLVYVALAAALVAVLIGLSFVLGERHRQASTGKPYESGVPSDDSPPGRLPVQFYRVAVFFVIFDVETVFLFAWAIALRESGWKGYVDMLVFVGVLAAALGYLWRLGSLDWGGSARRALASGRRRSVA
jgi:NADH-quinone oxidoreductase subunit A